MRGICTPEASVTLHWAPQKYNPREYDSSELQYVTSFSKCEISFCMYVSFGTGMKERLLKSNRLHVKFEISIAVTTKNAVLWYVGLVRIDVSEECVKSESVN
jgi:hypothetical protein